MTDTQNAPAAGGADPAANGGQGQQPGQQPGQQQAAADPPFWADLPENMRGATAEETLRKLKPSWEGYHKAHTTRGPTPKSVDEYVYEPATDKIKSYIPPDDPALAAFKAVALEEGLSGKAFNRIIEKTFGPLIEKGVLPEPFDRVANVKAIAGILGHKDLTSEAKSAIDAAEAELMGFAGNMGKQLGLTEAEQVELESLALTPGGFGLLRKLAAAPGAEGMRLGGKPAGQTRGKDEILADLNSPRANSLRPEYDRAFHQKVEAEFEALRRAGPPR